MTSNHNGTSRLSRLMSVTARSAPEDEISLYGLGCPAYPGGPVVTPRRSNRPGRPGVRHLSQNNETSSKQDTLVVTPRRSNRPGCPDARHSHQIVKWSLIIKNKNILETLAILILNGLWSVFISSEPLARCK